MDNTSTTTGTLDQTDEDILTYDVSDEALEAAAARVPYYTVSAGTQLPHCNYPCC
jgi:hypothetical protein